MEVGANGNAGLAGETSSSDSLDSIRALKAASSQRRRGVMRTPISAFQAPSAVQMYPNRSTSLPLQTQPASISDPVRIAEVSPSARTPNTHVPVRIGHAQPSLAPVAISHVTTPTSVRNSEIRSAVPVQYASVWPISIASETQPSAPPRLVSMSTAAPSTVAPSTIAQLTIHPPRVLTLVPFVQIGVQAVRPGPRRDPPEGYFAVCPSNRAYCIDVQASDNGTCMYPGPVEIKQCYDQSCIQSVWGPIVYRQQGEDTYCKDFMTAQGRLCQWVDSLPCTCSSKSIEYYDAEFVPNGALIPPGFFKPAPCVYPLDLIRQAAEEAAAISRNRKRFSTTRRPRRGKPQPEDAKKGREAKQIDDYDDKGHYAAHSWLLTVIAVVVATTI